VLYQVQPNLIVCLVLALASFAIAERALPSRKPISGTAGNASRDLLMRMLAAAFLVFGLTSLADWLGPSLTGFLTPFPIATAIILPIDDERTFALGRDSDRQAGHRLERLACNVVEAGKGQIQPPSGDLYCGLDARPPTKKHDFLLLRRCGSKGGAGGQWKELCHHLRHARQRANRLDINAHRSVGRKSHGTPAIAVRQAEFGIPTCQPRFSMRSS